jgi:dethiobiotin synthetase
MSGAAGLGGLFITATDTGVGKTQLVCWLARHWHQAGLRVGVCKPAASGAERSRTGWVWPDVERLRASCSAVGVDDLIAPFRWRLPLAPAVAERLEPALVRPGPSASPTLADFLAALDAWHRKCDVLLVEGTGGLFCPLTATATIADLAAGWGRPVLIVARLGLGTINHTLLTVEAAQRRALRIAGIVLNCPVPPSGDLAEQTNPEELRRWLKVPVFGPLPYQPEMDPVPRAVAEICWPRCPDQRAIPEKAVYD